MNPALQTAHLLTAAYMTGVIWFVQLVQYPMFHLTDGTDAAGGHREYTRRMGWVVMPVMLAELALQTAWLLTAPGLPSAAGAALLLIIWLSTFFLQVPCHQHLSCGHDPAVQRRLVHSNWIRTLAWTARALLLSATLA